MVDAKEKLVDVVTAARKQHADHLRVEELDFKRNRELWCIRGQGQPIMCELANRNMEYKVTPDNCDPRTWCLLPEDLLSEGVKQAKIVHHRHLR